MATTPVIAESSFFADQGTGVRKAVRVRIFMPSKVRRAFSCRVQMIGIAQPVRAVGEDTMQAVALSVRFVNNTLATRHRQGWRFYYTKDARAPFKIWQVWGHSPRLSAFQVPGEAAS